MQSTGVRLAALAGVVLAGAWGVGAQEGARPSRSGRGGLLAGAAGHQFEVFFYPTGARVFVRSASGTPVDVSRVTGSATFYHPNSPTPWFSRPLRAAGAESLDLAISLANAPTTGGKVTFEVTGLTGATGSTGTFTVPLEFVQSPAARTAPPQGGAAVVPRYVYGPGYSGYGYYQYTSPEARSGSAGVHSYSATPGMFAPGGMTVGPYHRDWTTGRTSPIAKPWLKPMD